MKAKRFKFTRQQIKDFIIDHYENIRQDEEIEIYRLQVRFKLSEQEVYQIISEIVMDKLKGD